jgi:hypothetical protein
MSNACPRCGTTKLERVHRSVAGRLLFRKVLQCGQCGFRAREWRVPFESTAAFVFSRYTRCIDCGSYRVRRMPSRDQIDRMTNRPLSLVFALTFAPIYHCGPCRLQYHDWRAVAPDARRDQRTA